MNCNCNNNGTSNAITNIRVVGGNVLHLAIPLTLRTIELVDNELVHTDTDFIPSSDYAVVVELSKGNIKIPIVASMDGNVAYIEDKGTIPVGTYSITVTCKDTNGNPYRFKQATALSIVDTTAEAGIELPIEYETATWYLDAALYLALKGEDGVSIDNITTQTSDEIGGYNYVTITLTDGRTTTFTVVNGSGRVDDNLDTQSPYPIANSVVATKFDQIDNSIGDLFGAVNYDSQSRTIRFYDKSGTRLLATLDAHPFIKDGMVNRAYISNNTLVILFNTDSEHDPITIPLSSVFNPNNYYTITQINNLLANYYNKSSVDSMVDNKADLLDDGRMPLNQAPPVVLDGINQTIPSTINASLAGKNIHYTNGKIRRYYSEGDGLMRITQYVEMDANRYFTYYNNADGKFYWWNGSAMVEIEIGGGTGDGTVTAVKMNNGTPIEPDSNGVVDLGTVITSHQDISGKANTSDLADVATSGSYNDLDDKPTITSAIAVNNSSHVPVNGVITLDSYYTQSEVDDKFTNYSDNFADVAFSGNYNDLGNTPTIPSKTSDLTNDAGFVTSSDVSNAVAGLVDSAPATLDTLNELAAALGDDANFATTVSTALGNKVDKVTGKGLSTEDYTTAEKTKLSGIAAGAEVNVQADWNETNTSSDAYIANKPTIPAAVTVDSSLTGSSQTNPVQGGAIYTALQGKEDRQQVIVDIQCESNYPVGFSIDGDSITGEELYSLCADPKKDVVFRMNGYDNDENDEADYDEDILYHLVRDSLTSSGLQYFIGFDELRYRFLSFGLVLEDEGSTIYFDAGIEELDYLPKYTFNNRKINNKPLSSDITLTASDVGALPSSTVIPAAQVQTDWNASSGMGVILNKPNLATVATSGSYNDLSNKPNLATVATSGSYNDLSNKPTIPDAVTVDSALSSTSTNPVQNKKVYEALGNKVGIVYYGDADAMDADVSQATGTIGWDDDNEELYIYDLPNATWKKIVDGNTLATVATSGSYNDLTNKPTIPTKVSDLQNDSGFTTNTGTVTGVKMNNGSAISPVNGVVDLGTVITSHQDISGKADVVTIVTNSSTGSVTQALDPNKFYKFTGALTALTLTLNSGTGLCIYAGRFTSDSSSACTVTLPSGVKLADGAPSVEAGGTYEFSIAENLMLLVKEGT